MWGPQLGALNHALAIAAPGWPYVEALEYGSAFFDDGATAYDGMDGNIDVKATYQLCHVPAGMQAGLEASLADYSDHPVIDVKRLACFKNVTSVDVNRPGSLLTVGVS